MDHCNGTVTNNATGELIFAFNFDKFFNGCEAFTNIAIIAPLVGTNHKKTYATDMFHMRLEKCIKHVKYLELVSPTKRLLEKFGIIGDTVSSLEKLALFSDDRATKSVYTEKIAIYIDRNLPNLNELCTGGFNLPQFDRNVDLRHLTLKIQSAGEEFDNALAFIKRCKQLNELTVICVDPVDFNDGKPIVEIIGKLDYSLQHDSENRANLTVLDVHNIVTNDRFSYNRNENTCHVPNIDLIANAMPFDCKNLEIQRINTPHEADKLIALMTDKKIESLTVGVDETLYKTVWDSMKNYSNVVVRCGNDQIYNNTTGNIQQADPVDKIGSHVYTDRSLFAMSQGISALNVSFHAYNDSKLLDQLSIHILQMQAITNLFIGSDHGLFKAILTNFDKKRNDFQNLSVLNVPKAALQPWNDITSLFVSMLDNEKRRILIIRNDDPRDRQITLLRDDLTKLSLGWSWNIDTDGCNIIGTKILYASGLRHIATQNKSMTY